FRGPSRSDPDRWGRIVRSRYACACLCSRARRLLISPSDIPARLSVTVFARRACGMPSESRVFLQRLEMRVEPDLGNERGHHGAADYCGKENGVLILIDDAVGEPEQRRDRAEGKPR